MLTKALLTNLFYIDYEKGVLYRKNRQSTTCAEGSVAGTPREKEGRVTLVIKGKRYLRSRIMWFLYYGEHLTEQIDHIDCRPWNDSKDNLRQVTDQINKLNKRMQKNNTSGITGVTWDKEREKWRAHLKYKGTTINLGRFALIEDAVYARETKLRELGFDEKHGCIREEPQ